MTQSVNSWHWKKHWIHASIQFLSRGPFEHTKFPHLIKCFPVIGSKGFLTFSGGMTEDIIVLNTPVRGGWGVGGGWRIYFGGELDGKGGTQFSVSGGSEFLEIAIINFTSRISFGLLFTCRRKDVSIDIFTRAFSFFRFIKSFLLILSYFIYNLFKRKIY